MTFLEKIRIDRENGSMVWEIECNYMGIFKGIELFRILIGMVLGKPTPVFKFIELYTEGGKMKVNFTV